MREKGIDTAIDRTVREFIAGNIAESAALFAYMFDYSNDGVRLAPWHLASVHLTLDEQE